jgi:hypothetical protein
MRQLR